MPPPISFNPPTMPDYLVHLWRRAWVVGLVGVAAGVGAALATSRPATVSYTATAEILVRPRPVAPESGRGAEPIPTPAFESLFVADETLEAARLAYNESAKAAGAAPLEGGPAALRALVDTSVRTTVDTTVYTQFSPVISLEVTTSDPAKTRALLDAWATVVIGRCGNMMEDEAAAARRRLSARAEALATDRRELLVEHYGTQYSLLMDEARIALAYRELYGHGLPAPTRPALSPGATTTVIVPPSIAPQPDGTDRVLAGDQQPPSINNEIRRGGDQLAEVLTQAAGTAGDLGAIEVRLAAVDAQLASVVEALRSPSLAGGAADAEGGGTLRLVSRGLEPVAVPSGANRLLPLLAAMAAMAGAVVLLVAELYLRRALASVPK